MKKENDLMTDDDAMRDAGMTAGPKRRSNFVLRPMTAMSLSWLQRNRVFDDEVGDKLQKTAAYVYLHTEPKEEIRAVVCNQADFMDAVDRWMDKHITYHSELEPLSEEMSEAMNIYLAANTKASTNPDPGISGLKN